MSFQIYEQRFATFAMRLAPRMGYTNEFSMLLSDDPNDQQDYTAGLVFLGAFLMVFFFMWGFGLAVCKWLGPEQVGFLSGWPMKKPDLKAKRLIQRKQPIVIRSVFACSALFWIIFTIIFLTVGLGSISNYKETMKNGNIQVNTALATANSLSLSLQTMGSSATVARDSLVKDLESLCPNPFIATNANPLLEIPTNAPNSATSNVSPAQFAGLVDNVNNVQTIDTTEEVANQFSGLFGNLAASATTTSPTGSPSKRPTSSPTGAPIVPTISTTIFDDIKSTVTTAITTLVALNDFIEIELDNGEDGINEAIELAAVIFGNADSSSPTAVAIIFSLPWCIVPLILVLAVGMAYKGKSKPTYENVLSKCLMPTFVLMTMASIALTTVMVSYSIATADFCSGGNINTPDKTMMDILVQRNITSGQLLYNAVGHYVSQCTEGDPFLFLDTYGTGLNSATAAMTNLETAITKNTSIEALVAICGSQVEGIDSLIISMETDLQELSSKVVEATTLLECTHLVPIYTTLVYDTACNTTVHGLYWAYISFLIMSLTGMTMITLRTAYLSMDSEAGHRAKSKTRGDIEKGSAALTVADKGDDSDSGSDSDLGSDSDDDGSDSDSDDSDKGSDSDDSDDDSDKDSDDDSDDGSGDDSDDDDSDSDDSDSS